MQGVYGPILIAWLSFGHWPFPSHRACMQLSNVAAFP